MVLEKNGGVEKSFDSSFGWPTDAKISVESDQIRRVNHLSAGSRHEAGFVSSV
jgi:hypothetical protein